MTIYWTDLGHTVSAYLNKTEEHAYILAPFIQPFALEQIMPRRVALTLVTSWQEADLQSGASSLDTYPICEKRGNVAYYIHPHIHLKIYGRDLTQSGGSFLTGSANVTGKGLGLHTPVNREILVEVNTMSMSDRVQLQRVVAEGQLVDNTLYEAHREWLSQCPPPPAHSQLSPPLPENPTPQFLITNLPLSSSPDRLLAVVWGHEGVTDRREEDAVIHDLALFSAALEPESISRESLASGFFSTPFVQEFLSQLDHEGMYFGEMKAWIQTNCDDVPAPRRKELTDHVRTLTRWIVDLAPRRFELVRPRHSQLLRRKHPAES